MSSNIVDSYYKTESEWNANNNSGPENIQSLVKSPVPGSLSDPNNVTQSWTKI